HLKRARYARALFCDVPVLPYNVFAMEAEPVLLDETLRPSPPMAPQTLLIILGVVLAFNIAFALSFVLRGAWPIAPFLGLDVALLAWAFRASTLAARRRGDGDAVAAAHRTASGKGRGHAGRVQSLLGAGRFAMADGILQPPVPAQPWTRNAAGHVPGTCCARKLRE